MQREIMSIEPAAFGQCATLQRDSVCFFTVFISLQLWCLALSVKSLTFHYLRLLQWMDKLLENNGMKSTFATSDKASVYLIQ